MAYLTFLTNILAALFFLALIRAVHDYRRRGGLSYPPGPRPLPIVGNLHAIPKEFPWLAYSRYSKTYGTSPFALRRSFLTGIAGDVMSFRLFGKVVVVLNSIKAAKDLLEKKGDVYSDRSVPPFYEM